MHDPPQSHGSLEPERCPVTGLPITARPEWRDVELDEGFSTTLWLVGDAIQVGQSKGHGTGRGVVRAMALAQRIVDDAVGPGQPYVQISDLTQLSSVSFDARRHYADALQGRDGLAGLVFCGASPLQKIAISLGLSLHLIDARVEVVDDLDTALRRAVELLGNRRAETSPAGADAAVTGRGARGPWELRLPGLTVIYSAVARDVMYSEVVGRFEAEHVEPIFKMNERVAVEMDAPPTGLVVVIGVAGMSGMSFDARRRWVREVLSWHRMRQLRLLVFHGAGGLVQAAVTISRPLVPFEVRSVGDRDAALALALGRGGRGRHRADRAAGGVVTVQQEDIESLMRLIGALEWGVGREIEAPPLLPADHSLAPLVDAFSLVKADLDEILEQRTRAEEAARQSEERYRTILETIVDGYYEVDRAGDLVSCNPSLLAMLGYSSEEMLGLNNRAYMDADNARRVFETFNRVWQTGEPAKNLGWELLRRDKTTVPVETSVTLVRDGSGRPVGFRGIIRDISERIRLEAELAHAHRMEAIGTLAGGVAHNFNNLLMGIEGNISLAASDPGLTEAHRRRLATVSALVKDGARLTAQLLGFAQSGRYEVRPLDVNALVTELVETVALARRDLRLSTELEPGLPAVRADRAQLQQVLLNLLLNAADAMPQGGDAAVRTRRIAAEQLGERSTPPRTPHYIKIEVSDTGVGMDSAVLERIFEPFFTTKGSAGTGLGLPSAYGIVSSHGGYLDVDSSPGAGSTFTVLLPASDEPAEAPSGPAPIALRGAGTVLVVDDDPAIAEAAAALVASLGYIPLVATSGRQAIEELQRRGQEIDVVLLDLVLPDMSGGEVFDALRAIEPGVRIVLSSGYSRDGEVARILERGCDDFLQKPYSLVQLSERLRSLLGSPEADT